MIHQSKQKMDSKPLTPEQSLALITQVIGEAKIKFEENGVIYSMWGAMLAGAALFQYAMLKNDQAEISFYGYFLLPLAALFSWYYYAKRRTGKKNQVSTNISISWGIVSLNLMVLGFFFHSVLQENLTPLLLILMGIGTAISGSLVRSQLILIAGLLLNVSGFICFQLDWINHPLLLGVSAILFILVPGLLLMAKYQRKNV